VQTILSVNRWVGFWEQLLGRFGGAAPAVGWAVGGCQAGKGVLEERGHVQVKGLEGGGGVARGRAHWALSSVKKSAEWLRLRMFAWRSLLSDPTASVIAWLLQAAAARPPTGR